MPDGTFTDIETSSNVGGVAKEITDKERFDRGLLKYQKNLKAYACSLSRDTEAADDLVQETMLRALANRDKFDCDTNLRAWLFTILKNLFLTKMRRGQREIELTDAMANGPMFSVQGAQEDTLLLKELIQGIGKLPRLQQRAVVLVAAFGYSIDEVSRHEKCPSGTVKSRVNRGRSALIDQFKMEIPGCSRDADR